MYKTIEASKNARVTVTEMASMGNIAFLVNGSEEKMQKHGYFMSRPFASGEIYVSSLLDSLMCQAYYSRKITEILDQLIMGSANTPLPIKHINKQLNLDQCQLHLTGIPEKVTNYAFKAIYEHCVKHHNMIPIAVYKRHFEDQGVPGGPEGHKEDKSSSRKPYVWLHPPKEVELSPHDELFVLADKNPKDQVNNS